MSRMGHLYAHLGWTPLLLLMGGLGHTLQADLADLPQGGVDLALDRDVWRGLASRCW